MMRLFLNLSSFKRSEIRDQRSEFSPLTSHLSSLFLNAEVVKLANTLRSGRSGRKSLRVQLPPSAVLEMVKNASEGYSEEEYPERRNGKGKIAFEPRFFRM